MTLITGKTYPVRSKIKALGGIWSKAKQGWLVPDSAAAEATRLVACAATHYREPAGYRDNSSHEDRCCGDRAYEDSCAAACGPGL